MEFVKKHRSQITCSEMLQWGEHESESNQI
jgi:hypothetical protein